MERPLNIVLLGPPGVGKGTQAKLLVEKLSIPQISTGEILRAAVSKKSVMGVKALPYMESGGLVPDEVVVGIVRERLAEPDCSNGFILDGFPRTVIQADVLKSMLVSAGKNLTAVVSLDASVDELVERLTGRRTCVVCGKGYHLRFEPPPAISRCDCGGDLYQREDDQEQTIRTRLDVYRQKTLPLIDYYAAEGLLVTVPGVGAVAEVQQRILTALKV